MCIKETRGARGCVSVDCSLEGSIRKDGNLEDGVRSDSALVGHRLVIFKMW